MTVEKKQRKTAKAKPLPLSIERISRYKMVYYMNIVKEKIISKYALKTKVTETAIIFAST